MTWYETPSSSGGHNLIRYILAGTPMQYKITVTGECYFEFCDIYTSCSPSMVVFRLMELLK